MKAAEMPVSVRPTPENRARLDYAKDELGMPLNTVINEVLNESLKDYIERERNRRIKALTKPVP